jgi:HSP20 family protein
MNQNFDSNRGPDQSFTYAAANFWTAQDSVMMSTEIAGLTDRDIEITVKDTMISVRGTFPEQQKADKLAWLRRVRIPEHPATHSDHIRPPVPTHSATCDALP